MFQLTAARRRLATAEEDARRDLLFQLTAARRRLVLGLSPGEAGPIKFQLTAARRRLAGHDTVAAWMCVSFNSQPPGGGWPDDALNKDTKGETFQLTAARRRLATTL